MTQPSLRGRVVLRFPADVVAGPGIRIDKTNSTYTISATGNGGGLGGVPEAPLDGLQYGRQNATWTQVVHTGDGTGGAGPYVLKAGDTMTGDLVMRYNVPNIVFDRQVNGQSGHLQGKFQGKLRWQMSLGDVDNEGTGNAGSNFRLQAYDDTGTNIIGIPFYIRRDTGKVTIGGPFSAPSGTPLLAINKIVAGLSASIRGELNSNARWQMSLGDQDPETGGNTGSNFRLQCYGSDGNIISVPLYIIRETGQIYLRGGPPIPAGQPIVIINSTSTEVPMAIRGTLNGAPRWQMALGDVTPLDDFRLQCYRDDGVLQAVPFWIRRADGKVTISANTPGGTPMLDLNRFPVPGIEGPSPPKPDIPGLVSANANISGSNFGVIRWHLSLGDVDPEVGAVGSEHSGVGSNFRIHAYDNSGVSISAALYIIRDSQDIYMFRRLFIPGGIGGIEAVGSDSRIKTVLGDYTTGVDALKNLQPKIYSFKGNDTAHRDPPITPTAPGVPNPESPHYRVAIGGDQFVGFVAQDVEPYVPEMVTERDADINGVHVTDYKGLDHSYLVPILVNCIKELDARVVALEGALGRATPPSPPPGVRRGKQRRKFYDVD